MRFYLTGLALTVIAATSCRHFGQRNQTIANPLVVAAEDLRIPQRVDERNIETAKTIYSALDMDDKRRAPLQKKLRDFHIMATRLALKRDDHEAAIAHFGHLLKLTPPSRVYDGPIHDPELDRTAQQVLSRFSRWGAVQHVLPALIVRMSLRPDLKKALEAQYHQVIAWNRQFGRKALNGLLRDMRLVSHLENVSRMWPSRFVIQQLIRLYRKRYDLVMKLKQARVLRDIGKDATDSLQSVAYEISRLYISVNQLPRAVTEMSNLRLTDRDKALNLLLKNASRTDHEAIDLIMLSRVYEKRDPDISLTLCRAAVSLEPEKAPPYACVGRVATLSKNLTLAIIAYEAAVAMEPHVAHYSEQLAQQYHRQLFRLVEQNKLDRTYAHLNRVVDFYEHAKTQLGKPLKPPLSRVFFAFGYGLYNAGKVNEARKAFTKSLAKALTPEGLVQLATIEVKAGNFTIAHRYLNRAKALPLDGQLRRTYWRGRIASLRAKAFQLQGHHKKSLTSHHSAVKAWSSWLVHNLRPEAKAEAYVHIARSYYAINEKTRALEALESAIDAAPDRKETYADVLSMLSMHGHLPEALDAYHRALGRPEVTEYLKAYCSFWVISLAKRAGRQPDPLAVSYLERLSGTKWYHRLAKLFLGHIPYKKLAMEAKDDARKAELFFYQAELLLSKGQVKQARRLWQKVLATNMMAFFEYDMATHNLHHGPTTASVHPIDRRGETHRKPNK